VALREWWQSARTHSKVFKDIQSCSNGFWGKSMRGLADGHHAAVTFDTNCANEREFQLAKIREISVKGFWFAFKIKPNTGWRKVMQGDAIIRIADRKYKICISSAFHLWQKYLDGNC
jgi:hypothetical protein